jgi:hypothetical protein
MLKINTTKETPVGLTITPEILKNGLYFSMEPQMPKKLLKELQKMDWWLDLGRLIVHKHVYLQDKS